MSDDLEGDDPPWKRLLQNEVVWLVVVAVVILSVAFWLATR